MLGPDHEKTKIIQAELKSCRANLEVKEAVLKDEGVFPAVLSTPNHRIDSNGILVLSSSSGNKSICVVKIGHRALRKCQNRVKKVNLWLRNSRPRW